MHLQVQGDLQVHREPAGASRACRCIDTPGTAGGLMQVHRGVRCRLCRARRSCDVNGTQGGVKFACDR